MRVIAGEAGGLSLQAPPGRDTRPTTDKVKGAMFSALGDAGCTGRVLDGFAGSGALGIEALSRGADFCDFVESAAAACRAIRANLERTRLAGQAAVHAQPLAAFIASATGGAGKPHSSRTIGASADQPDAGPYDLILLDPPYALGDLPQLLVALCDSPLVGEGTVLLVEHASRRPLPPRLGALQAQRTRTHGDSAFTIFVGGR